MLNKEEVNIVKLYLKKAGLEDKILQNDFLDHICCIIEKQIEQGHNFNDALEYSFKELPIKTLKQIELSTLKLINMEIIFSRKTALFACIPFLLMCVGLYIPMFTVEMPKSILLFFNCGAIFSMFTLFVVGWSKDFPRWSLPSIGFCLIISLYFTNVKIPSLMDDLLGLWAWVPFSLTIAFSILIHPSLNPLKQLFHTLKKHPKLGLFILFGIIPFLSLILCDEIYSVWIIPIGIINTSIITLGLYTFLTHTNRNIRNWAIAVSSLLPIVISIVFAYVYWGRL